MDFVKFTRYLRASYEALHGALHGALHEVLYKEALRREAPHRRLCKMLDVGLYKTVNVGSARRLM